jgi:hypothetical protein
MYVTGPCQDVSKKRQFRKGERQKGRRTTPVTKKKDVFFGDELVEK